MSVCLSETKEETQTQRRMSQEDWGRDQSDATTAQELPKLASSCERLGERHGRFSLKSPQVELILPGSWFQTSGLHNYGRINFCCFRSPSLHYLCSYSHRKLVQAYWGCCGLVVDHPSTASTVIKHIKWMFWFLNAHESYGGTAL